MIQTRARISCLAAAVAGLMMLVVSCSTSGANPDDTTTDDSGSPAVSGSPSQAAIQLPPVAAKFDYQLGGAYPPPAGVKVVSRDGSASPATGIYNICYVNAFQAQPDATAWWQTNHPDLLLRAQDGSLVIDQNWNEALLDVSTQAKRAELAQIEYGWIDACAKKGFQAIEPDNLDSYSRSNGLLTTDDDAAFAELLTARAHGDSLAIGQKNTAELLSRRQQIGFDFAVAEQCGTYNECGQYAAAYADRVLDIEYDSAGLTAACATWAGRISIIQRDQDVNPQGSPDYIYKAC